LTWPRAGIPTGSGYLVAPGGEGYPEVRIAVPDDPDGEAEALGEALNDPEIAAALGGDPRAPSIPEEEVYAEFGYTPLARRFSGNVRVRLPTELHRALATQAKHQGVSLNTLIVSYLADKAARTAALAERGGVSPGPGRRGATRGGGTGGR
jgi:hypothetical protein